VKEEHKHFITSMSDLPLKKQLQKMASIHGDPFTEPSDSESTSSRNQKTQILSTSPAYGHPTIEPSSKSHNITF
jgi:hypothetical protein